MTSAATALLEAVHVGVTAARGFGVRGSMMQAFALGTSLSPSGKPVPGQRWL